MKKTIEKKRNSFVTRPLHERPRERLSFLGASHLNDDELLSLVFGSGAALPIARLLLDQAGGVTGLKKIGFAELCVLPQIGKARASQLKAALELGKRALQLEPLYEFFIQSPSDVATLLQTELSQGEQEAFHVFGVDARHRVRSRHIAAIGQIDRVYVSSMDVFRPLVREGVAAVLVAHNHPSGEASPSDHDYELTGQLLEAGKLLGIQLLDHIIVASSGYYSFSEQGFFAKNSFGSIKKQV